jgi:ferredoxin-NADP reductase
MSAVVRPSLFSPYRWLSPSLFDFWAGQLNPLWTLREPMARLVRREPAGEGAATLVLRCNRHWAGMRAGQHVTLGVELEGRVLRRSYSPTRLGRRELAITVKAVEGGKVSQHLVAHAKPGDLFRLDAAFGDFHMPAAAPVLLLAAGSGITPMRSLLRDACQRPLAAPVDLFYWERSAAAFQFRDELQALAAANPNLRVHLLTTREGEVPAARINSHALAVAGDDTPLAQQVAGFQAEAFTPPAALSDADSLGEVALTLARSGRRLIVPRGRSLLESLEAQGIAPKHGCRMGICNSCTCERVSGTTRHLRTGDIQSETAVPVRICVSAPTTDLTLDL